ncbi:MAG: hypothetical protein M0D54_06140 [Hyphomonadaceae bacterium JAD_PAG50586_4]|nr:MAG: hypothetical protein M0D54_06140 [Hyphomonadaceae bacterium JAD_PAG50586_4]
MLLSVRMDEAGTDGKSPCLTMGGFVGTIPDWNRFDIGWRKRLKRVGMDDFHATEFWENQTAAARKLSSDEKRQFARKLWEWQHRCLRFAITSRLDNEAFEYYCTQRPAWLHRDSQFGLCFRLTVGIAIPQAAKFFGDNVRMNFLLEQGHKNIGDAARIFSEIQSDTDVDFTRKLGTFSTGKRTTYPGLQAADGIISTAQRIESKNKQVFSDVEPQATLSELSTEKIPAPVLRAHFGNDIIDRYIEGRARERQEKHDSWLTRKAAKTASSVSSGE